MRISHSLIPILFLSIPGSNSFAHSYDLKNLPLGDGKISTAPKKGWIWACHVDPQAGGAFRNGPWIKSNGTYDFTAKAVVSGSVRWPSHFEIHAGGDRRSFISNDLPTHGTGVFPVSPADAAYQYDRNPNSISQQNMSFTLPMTPNLADTPSCAPGAVGILLSGSVLFNALDAPGRDAVAHETQDSCQGHPQEGGVYHYHSLSTCMKDVPGRDGHSQLMGYALDGFGIFGKKGVGGVELSSDDLDECHGHTHEIDWDGRRVKMYHYHATSDFPYTVGCMRGKYDIESVRMISGPTPSRSGGMNRQVPGEPNPFPPGGPMERHHPDLEAAAQRLGISRERLREALGPPPPDLNAAAGRLGISVDRLREALGVPQR